jgi:hypothetical protein
LQIDRGPIPAIHGVVRWRQCDLGQWLWEEFRISVSPQTLSREVRAMATASSRPGLGTIRRPRVPSRQKNSPATLAGCQPARKRAAGRSSRLLRGGHSAVQDRHTGECQPWSRLATSAAATEAPVTVGCSPHALRRKITADLASRLSCQALLQYVGAEAVARLSAIAKHETGHPPPTAEDCRPSASRPPR